jgi:hypothetical protein
MRDGQIYSELGGLYMPPLLTAAQSA